MKKIPAHVWHLKGANQNGPTICILGGVHGDELTGIAVIKRLAEKFGITGQDARSFYRDDITGNLFFGLGNPAAIELGKRSASPVRDLNRCFIPELINKAPLADDAPDILRARELAPILEQTDILLDLHAASSPTPPFVALEDYTRAHRDIARFTPAQFIIGDAARVYQIEGINGVPGTTHYFIDRFSRGTWCNGQYGKHHGIGLCYETGYEKDLSTVEDAYTSVLRILQYLKVVNDDCIQLLGCNPDRLRGMAYSKPRHYVMSFCGIAASIGFPYAPGMNQGWRKVKEGEELGRYANGERVIFPKEGMLLFPLAPHKVAPGKILYCLARPGTEG